MIEWFGILRPSKGVYDFVLELSIPILAAVHKGRFFYISEINESNVAWLPVEALHLES